MENNSILKKLFDDYEIWDNENYKEVVENFGEFLKKLELTNETKSDIADLVSKMEYISNKIYFGQGFKYGVQMIKELIEL